MRICSWTSSVIAIVSAFSIAGCSRSDAPPAPEKGAKLKVAAVFTTPIEEPWDGCVHLALLKARSDLGIEYQWAESVPRPDYERVVREFADRGFPLIMGDAFGSEEAVRRVARDFPATAFCFGSGLGPVEPNFSVFDDWIHEPAYLCGMIAGKLTKTHIIGLVGGYSVPEVNRIMNAFIAGAHETDPEVKVKVSFINSWFDPPKAKEAARAQIASGADLLFGERYGVIEAAKEKGIPAFGNMVDQSSLAPDTVISSPVWDMWPTVQHVVNAVRSGTYRSMDYAGWTMMRKGGARLAPFHRFESRLSPGVREMVRKRTGEIMDGVFRVPIHEKIPVSD